MSDVLDVGLDDGDRRAEIVLVSELMVAAAESAGALGQSAVDALLGLGASL